MDLGEVALALHDFIPVALAAAGLALVARAIRIARPPAYTGAVAGAVLVVLGGVSKAIAKLIRAVAGDVTLQVLDEALFPLLAAGMLLLAAAAMDVRRPRARPLAAHPVVLPVAVWGVAGLLAILASPGAAKGLLIGLATLGNVILGVALIRWSASLGLRRAAVLYAVNLTVVIGLAGMARVLEQGTAAQWIEQNVNVLGQLAFFVASKSLADTVRRPEARAAETRATGA